jgi:hypothetical protein
MESKQKPVLILTYKEWNHNKNEFHMISFIKIFKYKEKKCWELHEWLFE